jgi:hypothetical protein
MGAGKAEFVNTIQLTNLTNPPHTNNIMKKAFLTLYFLVSASFAMANTIENEQPATQTIEDFVKPQGSCTSTLLEYDEVSETYYEAVSVTVNCGRCSDADACSLANRAIDVVIGR